MQKQRGSVEAIREILKLGDRIAIDEMVRIDEQMEAVGGKFVALSSDDDDDWCGNGRFHIPWPPRDPQQLYKVLDMLVEARIDFEVLINGIPVPEEIMMRVSRGLRR